MSTPPPARRAGMVAGGLSLPDLCLAWRRSYLALLTLPAGPAKCEVVQLRQHLLDELERRDGDGFRRWLDTGPRAGADPGRYLCHARSPSSDPDANPTADRDGAR